MSIVQFKKVGKWLFEKLMDAITYLFYLSFRFSFSRRRAPLLEPREKKQTKRVVNA